MGTRASSASFPKTGTESPGCGCEDSPRQRAAYRGHGAHRRRAGHHARPAQLDHDRCGDPLAAGGLRPLPRLGDLDRGLLPGRHGRRPAAWRRPWGPLRPAEAPPDRAYSLSRGDGRRHALLAHRGLAGCSDRAGNLRRRRHPERHGADSLARSPRAAGPRLRQRRGRHRGRGRSRPTGRRHPDRRPWVALDLRSQLSATGARLDSGMEAAGRFPRPATKAVRPARRSLPSV